MTVTNETNKGMNASNWGFWGFVGGVVAGAAATAASGGVISAWVCTKCLVTGMTAGLAAFGLKGSKDAEEVARQAAESTREAAIEFRDRVVGVAERTAAFSRMAMTSGVSLLGAGLSFMNYHTIGKDCPEGSQSTYCTTSARLFQLSSVICAGALIITAGLGIRYLHIGR